MTTDSYSYINHEKPQTLNLYAYCANNPVSNVDPDGNNPLVGALLIPGVAEALAAAAATVATAAGAAVVWIAGTAVGDKIKESKSKKQAKQSAKEKSTDAPSWAKQQKPKAGEDAKKFTERILNDKYGKDNYKRGPGSEYNKINKWATRSLGLK